LELDNEQLKLRLKVREEAIATMQEKITTLTKLNVLVNSLNASASTHTMHRRIASMQNMIDKLQATILEKEKKAVEKKNKLQEQHVKIKKTEKLLKQTEKDLQEQQAISQYYVQNKINDSILLSALKEANLDTNQAATIIKQHNSLAKSANNSLVSEAEMYETIKELRLKIAKLQAKKNIPTDADISESQLYQQQILLNSQLIAENTKLENAIFILSKEVFSNQLDNEFTQLTAKYNTLKDKHNALASKQFVTNELNKELILKLEELKVLKNTPIKSPKNYTLEYTKPLKDKIENQRLVIDELSLKIEKLERQIKH
jgi:hypothetical protein